MKTQFQWTNSLAPTDRNVGVLQEKWEELLSQNHLTGNQDPGEPEQTVYELLSMCPDTAEFVRCVERFPAVRDVLQNRTSVHTIWVPTNSAFTNFNQDDAELEQILQYHISPHCMPVLQILHTPNIPTLVQPPALNGALRLRLRLSSRGIQANGHATIIRNNLWAKNGVVHLVDQVISLPPPLTEVLLGAPDAQFSRFHQGLRKTGLADDLASSKFVGCTVFAPNDPAFASLGSVTEAFLFDSPEGTRYLRTLLEYHVVPNETLFSNAFYHGNNPTGGSSPPAFLPPRTTESKRNAATSPSQKPENRPRLLKGTRTFPLPTLLSGCSVHVEVARFAGMISMFVKEGEASVVTQDIIALDGVVHVVDRVLLPEFASLFSTNALDGTRSSWQPDLKKLKAVLREYFDGQGSE